MIEEASSYFITHKGRSPGSIYLTERTDKQPFSEADESKPKHAAVHA